MKKGLQIHCLLKKERHECNIYTSRSRKNNKTHLVSHRQNHAFRRDLRPGEFQAINFRKIKF